MSYQRISGTPTLVERRSYGNLPPRAMGGVWDTLMNLGKGASDVYQATKNSGAAPASSAAPPPVYAPPPQESGFKKYLPAIAIGGLAIGAIILLKRK